MYVYVCEWYIYTSSHRNYWKKRPYAFQSCIHILRNSGTAEEVEL